jgi:transcriptional regulator with XRE-family HTH domain
MQTIGERLEEARKKKGMSIREAAEGTKIRGDYLQKFESNDFNIGLTEIYTRGFLRSYAVFLKVPADRILNDYAALGRSEVRPRQPNREVYGRMDISVASAGDGEDRAAPPAEPAEAATNHGANAPRYPRTSTNLPSGPDPAVIFRYLKWGGGAVALLLVVWLLSSLLSNGSPTAARPSPTPNANPPAPAAMDSYALVAVEPVFVRVTQLIPPDTDGEEVFKGTLTKGQSQTIPWTVSHNIWASAGENVMLEYRGKRYPLNFTGYGHSQMPKK